METLISSFFSLQLIQEEWTQCYLVRVIICFIQNSPGLLGFIICNCFFFFFYMFFFLRLTPGHSSPPSPPPLHHTHTHTPLIKKLGFLFMQIFLLELIWKNCYDLFSGKKIEETFVNSLLRVDIFTTLPNFSIVVIWYDSSDSFGRQQLVYSPEYTVNGKAQLNSLLLQSPAPVSIVPFYLRNLV